MRAERREAPWRQLKEFADLLRKMIRHRLEEESNADPTHGNPPQAGARGKSRKTDGLVLVVAESANKLLG
jgi:hypothetical protein